jgi:hypothetical protein
MLQVFGALCLLLVSAVMFVSTAEAAKHLQVLTQPRQPCGVLCYAEVHRSLFHLRCFCNPYLNCIRHCMYVNITKSAAFLCYGELFGRYQTPLAVNLSCACPNMLHISTSPCASCHSTGIVLDLDSCRYLHRACAPQPYQDYRADDCTFMFISRYWMYFR